MTGPFLQEVWSGNGIFGWRTLHGPRNFVQTELESHGNCFAKSCWSGPGDLFRFPLARGGGGLFHHLVKMREEFMV